MTTKAGMLATMRTRYGLDPEPPLGGYYWGGCITEMRIAGHPGVSIHGCSLGRPTEHLDNEYFRFYGPYGDEHIRMDAKVLGLSDNISRRRF